MCSVRTVLHTAAEGEEADEQEDEGEEGEEEPGLDYLTKDINVRTVLQSDLISWQDEEDDGGEFEPQEEVEEEDAGEEEEEEEEEEVWNYVLTHF